MKMKKLIVSLVATVMCVSTVITASAATTAEDVIAKLKAGVTVDGKVITIPASYVNQAQIALDKTTVTAEQAEAMIAKIDEVQAVAEKKGITSLTALKENKTVLNEVVTLSNDAAKVIGYSVSYNANSSEVVAKDATGNTVFSSKVTVNQTGFDSTATVAVSVIVIAMLAACVVFTKKRATVNA